MPQNITETSEKIIYYPRIWTKLLHEGKERWKVIVAHRRSGKTTACINHLIRNAMEVSNSKYAYISPTYKQSKNIAWDIIKEYTRKVKGILFNEAELRCDFANGSRITLFGADNPDSLRGIGLWGVVFDEYSQQPSNIFTEIIRPALADHNGFAIWIGTPKGKNSFYDLYEFAKKHDDWLDLILTVEDTDLISDEELDSAEEIMSKDEFEQEWYCSFEAAIKGAYYQKELAEARKGGRLCPINYEKGFSVHTFWDLGVADATAIGFFQNIGTDWRMIDYYEASGEGLAHYAKVLQDKGYVYGQHFAPHDIEVRELGSGKSRLETSKELGIDFAIAPNLPIIDGIQAVRSRFNSLWFNTDKCEQFLHNLSLYRKEWDDKRGTFRNIPLHDFTSHSADMLRYWAVSALKSKKTITQFIPKYKENRFSR